jgi:hypothetical protein
MFHAKSPPYFGAVASQDFRAGEFYTAFNLSTASAALLQIPERNRKEGALKFKWDGLAV